jgi:hypothetical protein
MRIEEDKLDSLVMYMERWLSGGATRNVGMLARLTGITSQTVRRILQRETYPELETALCLLNIVASPEEAMHVVSSSKSFVDFVAKIKGIKSDESLDESQDVAMNLNNRERFWCYMLALTVGLTRDRIERLCGSYGLFEMESMIEEKLFVESVPGEYVPSLKQENLVIENKEVYARAPGYVADLALVKESALRLYLVYNVTEKDAKQIEEKMYRAYAECEEIARNSNGSIVLASAFVATKVLGENK